LSFVDSSKCGSHDFNPSHPSQKIVPARLAKVAVKDFVCGDSLATRMFSVYSLYVILCLQHVTSNMEALIWSVDPTSVAYSRPELTRQLHSYLDGQLITTLLRPYLH